MDKPNFKKHGGGRPAVTHNVYGIEVNVPQLASALGLDRRDCNNLIRTRFNGSVQAWLESHGIYSGVELINLIARDWPESEDNRTVDQKFEEEQKKMLKALGYTDFGEEKEPETVPEPEPEDIPIIEEDPEEEPFCGDDAADPTDDAADDAVPEALGRDIDEAAVPEAVKDMKDTDRLRRYNDAISYMRELLEVLTYDSGVRESLESMITALELERMMRFMHMIDWEYLSIVGGR